MRPTLCGKPFTRSGSTARMTQLTSCSGRRVRPRLKRGVRVMGEPVVMHRNAEWVACQCVGPRILSHLTKASAQVWHDIGRWVARMWVFGCDISFIFGVLLLVRYHAGNVAQRSWKSFKGWHLRRNGRLTTAAALQRQRPVTVRDRLTHLGRNRAHRPPTTRRKHRNGNRKERGDRRWRRGETKWQEALCSKSCRRQRKLWA